MNNVPMMGRKKKVINLADLIRKILEENLTSSLHCAENSNSIFWFPTPFLSSLFFVLLLFKFLFIYFKKEKFYIWREREWH